MTIDLLKSEWTKIRSVRSTMWTLAVTFLLMTGFAALLGTAVVNNGDEPLPGGQAILMSLNGRLFASLAMATLGTLVISSEYRTGSIRLSLMAVPRRMRLLTAKIVVFTAMALVVTTVSAAAAIGVGLAIMQPASVEPGEIVRASIGTGLYLTACGLLGLGLGTLVRHTPGAVVSAIGLIMVLPAVANQLPGVWGETVADYITANAGMLILSGQSNGSLGPWSGFAVYLVWVAVAMAAGAVLLQRRDA
jgi:ABC-2 type transport system permease protein